MKQWKKLFIRKNCDVPTFCGVLVTAYREIWKQTRQPAENLFGYFKDKHFAYYVRGADEQEVGRILYRRYFNRPEQIKRAYHQGLAFLRTTSQSTQIWQLRIAQAPRANKSTKLLGAFNEFIKSFNFINYRYSIMPWWALEAWQHDFEDCIGQLIRKRGLQDRYDIIMASILRPWKLTAIGEVGRALQRRASVNKLVEHYQYLRSWTVVWHKPITAAWIRSTAQISETQGFRLLGRTELFKLLQPTPHDQKYLDMAPYNIFFKDWRDDFRRKHAYDWSFLFETIARHFSISYTDIGYFTLDEISNALKNDHLDTKLLRQRKGKSFVFTIKLPRLQLRILAPTPKKYYIAMREAEKTQKTKTVRGIVAQSGFVTGPVKVIRNFHDIKRIEAGDILVTNTTHPNYLQGMKKAAAFVTNEGGIISHAAIVAREFKKPCVVGTKIATQVFKDGDMVEVNATTGIVRKV